MVWKSILIYFLIAELFKLQWSFQEVGCLLVSGCVGVNCSLRFCLLLFSLLQGHTVVSNRVIIFLLLLQPLSKHQFKCSLNILFFFCTLHISTHSNLPLLGKSTMVRCGEGIAVIYHLKSNIVFTSIYICHITHVICLHVSIVFRKSTEVEIFFGNNR